MGWPEQRLWLAMAEAQVRVDGERWSTHRVDCGTLVVPTGRLVICDPFVALEREGNPYVRVAPGVYPVTVTVADVSGELDGSHLREAYASLVLNGELEVRRSVLQLGVSGETVPELAPDEFVGFPVDSGTACFVDGGAVETAMPEGDWYTDLFNTGQPDAWFERIGDPAHIRSGIANITLPLATGGENIVVFQSGWGDGYYPVVAGYDAAGQMVAVHVDLMVITADAELLAGT
jgi:Protein of unknown function (DUF4241)